MHCCTRQRQTRSFHNSQILAATHGRRIDLIHQLSRSSLRLLAPLACLIQGSPTTSPIQEKHRNASNAKQVHSFVHQCKHIAPDCYPTLARRAIISQPHVTLVSPEHWLPWATFVSLSSSGADHLQGASATWPLLSCQEIPLLLSILLLHGPRSVLQPRRAGTRKAHRPRVKICSYCGYRDFLHSALQMPCRNNGRSRMGT